MSKKNKVIIGIIVPLLLILTLVTLLLVFCLNDSSTSAKSAKVRGGITFEGMVNVDISNGVIEEGSYLGNITGKMQGFTIGQSQNDQKNDSWKGIDLEFVKKEADFKAITVNFEITNFGNEKIFVQYEATKNLGNNANNITIDITGEDSILPACTEGYSITFSALEYEDSSLDNFDIKFYFVEERYSEIKGNFTFVGENCNAKILNASIEEDTYQGNIEGKLQNILLNNNQNENINTWKDLKLRFIEKDDEILPITLEFDIKNNIEEKLFVNFEITNGSGENSENIEINCDKTNEISSFGQEHYKITFSLKEKEISKLENFNIKITLTKEEVSWVKGSINFAGEGFDVLVSKGNIKDEQALAELENKLKGFSFLDSQNLNLLKQSWQNLKLQFIEKDNAYLPIEVEFDITNNMEERLFVNFNALKGTGENFNNISIETIGNVIINGNSQEHYKIKFTCQEFDVSKLDNFQINISFVIEEFSEIKGNVVFEGEDNCAEIKGGVIEEGTYQGNIESKFKDFIIKNDNSQTENVNSWKGLKLRFIENDDNILPIELEFDIKNNFEERLLVNFEIANGSGENSENVKIENVGQNVIASYAQNHYLIRFSLKEKEISKLENFNIKITLTKEEVSWVKGSINFAGEGFDALVSKGNINDEQIQAELENKLKGFSFLDSQNLSLLKQSWQNLKLQFVEKDNAYLPIEVEFDITNNMEERLFVDFNISKGTGENSDNISIEIIGNNIINGNSQEHYKIKFSCLDFDISKLDNFQINISFVKEEIARVNGDVSFIGENLKISISNGTLHGGNLNGDITSKFNSIDFEKSDESDFNQKLNTWKDVSIQFEKENFEAQPITLSFSITNNCDERVNLDFDIIKGLGTNVDNITINLLGSTVVQPNETENYTITFLCDGENRTILDKFSININMEEAVSVRANGKISFSGTNINANISNGLIEEGSFIGDISGKMQGFNFNSSMTEDELGQKLSTWENIDFKFVENENEFLPITISFDILNNNYERYDLTVNLVKGQGENTDNINIQTTTIRRIAALNKLNYTIKFTVSEFIKSSLSGWELNIRIVKNYEAKTLNDDGYYNNMLFEFSADQAITASDLNVKGKALISSYEDLEDVNETLIIPAYIQKEDGLYRVVGIKEATSASNSVFANQNALKIVSLPCTFEMVGDYAFYGCANLSNIILRNPIQQIGNYAFYNCGKLSDIVIPDTVTSIGNYAFYNCTNLENVTVSKILKTIGDRSFYNCYRLTTLTLPETVTGIGSYAFYRCSALSNFVIPKNIKEIKDWTFYYCAALTEIELPAGLINIGTSAFESCYGLETLTFPLRVTNIGNNAFYNCKNLKSITMGLNVRTIGKNAFTSCPKLEEIIVNEKNKYFEDGGGNSIIEKSTNTLLIGCKTTQIAENVSIIGENAFYYSSELESITIPAGVITIAESAFDNCSLLSNIVFAPNSSLVTIGDYAFQSCKALQEINIPQSVETIGMSCFFSCSELKSIYIGKSVVDISPTAFNRCSNIESIVVSDENEVYESSNANAIIQKDGKILVLGCQNTIIPEGIKTISTNAFNGCQLLTQINIPASVETIESSAFSSCNNLKTVIIDNETIAEGLVGNSLQIRALFGGLVRKATTIYIKEGMNVGSYVVTNFTLSAISDGYSIYIK